MLIVTICVVWETLEIGKVHCLRNLIMDSLAEVRRKLLERTEGRLLLLIIILFSHPGSIS